MVRASRLHGYFVLGWQLYCHSGVIDNFKGRQYNCHPNKVFPQDYAIRFRFYAPSFNFNRPPQPSFSRNVR